MKKVLALVLTLVMLVGSLTVGLSAVQVITENKSVNKFQQNIKGNSYMQKDIGNQGENFDVELDVRLDSEEAKMGGYGIANGPAISTSTVGVGDQTLPYEFTVGQWYHVKLDAEAGKTTVYVNGASVGEVNAVPTLYEGNQIYNSWDAVSFDNLRYGNFFTDFEDDVVVGTQGQIIEDETITYANENISKAEDAYWNIGPGNDYVPFVVGSQDSNFDVEMDVRLLEADAYIGSWIVKGPYFSTSGVGVDDQKIEGTYNVNQWYHIKWDAEGGETTIYVDGVQVGKVNKTAELSGSGDETCVFWHFNKIDFDNVRVGTYFNDMESELGLGEGYNGQKLVQEKILAKYDLGTKYQQNIKGNSYMQKDIGNQGENFDVELDVRLDSEEAKMGGYGIANGPAISTSTVGVGDQTLPYEFKVGQWYHVKLDAEAGKTTVYVDDVKVGEVNAVPTLYEGNQIYNSWDAVSFDNLRYGNFFTDFEDDVVVGTQGQILEYEIKQTTIFDNFETYPVEGEATLINALYNDAKDPSKDDNALYTTTTHTSGAVPKNYIVNFDLAIYPDKDGTISSDKTKDGSWVEFIVNKFGSSDNSRLKIGNKFVGKNKDLYYYGEDEIVKDMQPWAPGEFHNVTLQISNGKAVVYIDKVQVYESPVGMDNWDDLCIFYFDNCNAIMDNYRIYDAKTFETKVDTLKFSTGEEYVKTLSDVKAADTFCETNGCHINSWARTTDPKCYEMGTNTYKCWICGAEEAKAEVPMLEHSYAHYDIKRVNEEGLVFTYCKTSEGCQERRYIQLPAAEDYTGELKFYHDFQDDFIKVTSSDCGFEAFEDGVAKYISSDYNYNQIGFGREVSSEELNGGLKLGFDFSIDGTFDTDASLGRYGHSFDVLLGKGTLGAATIKYNMDTEKFYITATNNNFIETESEGTYTLVPGEVYNFEVSFAVDEENMTAELAVYLNGVEVVRMDEFDAYDQLPYNGSINCLLMHVFGLKINVDNLVMGSYDFSWNRDYAGDVDGDYDITSADALLMRKYLAKIVDLDALYVSRADVNGDGYIDAIDQLRIRKALAD